jgi:hypothetical protein
MSLDMGLVAHWTLRSDARDAFGQCHGDARGVRFESGAASFDGRGAHIEVPDRTALQTGAGDFSIAVHVHTDEILDNVLGDIVSTFDPQTRRGINLCLMNYAGVTSAQSNHRNLFFGIDNGKLDSAWTDCGRPGNNLMVWALCVFQGDLYAGTFETGTNEAGHVYRYLGGTAWEDCGAPALSNAVTSLAEFDGKLHAAASHYRSRGSSISESENETPGGAIFRYEGGRDWTNCGTVDNPEAIFGLASYRGHLYASSMYAPPGVFRYEGGTSWKYVGHSGGRIAAMTVHRGSLYGTGYDAEFPGVYRYAGGEVWENCGAPAGVTQSYSFAQHFGELYLGTWPGGRVFRYDGEMGWEDTGRLGEEEEVMGMAVYNGKLYGGTLPLAEVHRYDGDGQWTNTGRLDHTPDVRYRRAWSMAVYQGRLFCGTLPSGHVHSIKAGACATYDRALAPGWRHVAAIRDGGILKLLVDGREVARSESFNAEDFDLSTEKPLLIGFGAHDYFNGSMRDLRWYSRALTAEEVALLADV